ncbi:hypothetical protein LIER_14249 [Lithospermum erythrorhizon]|uniref:DUF7054 domain-containing protein n=1 Tax=Lithospermum erythrorhizon TaxID=34254 RepID=A0AAV3PYE7_LITER
MGIRKENKGNRYLICVSLVDSTGPFMLVVYEEDTVETVIKMVLKSHARQGRIPNLGYDVNAFMLYDCSDFEEPLRPSETIGPSVGGVRKFTMCKKPNQETGNGEEKPKAKSSGGPIRRSALKKFKPIKDWLDKSLHFKVLSH